MHAITTRREFLKTSSGAAAALGIAATCTGCALFHKRDVQAEAPRDASEMTLPFDRYPRIKEPNGIVRLEAKGGDLRLIVVRLADGSLTAVSMVCTHLGCDIDWNKTAARFDCPCHGSKFGPTGAVVEGPAEEPLARYPVTETPDGLTVRLTRSNPDA